MSDNSTPAVRFDGFTNAWEQRRIQDFCKVTSGEFVIKTKQDDSYPYPVYNGGKTNTGYYSEYNQTGNKVIISARGAAGFVNRSATAFWAGNSCHSIEVLDESDWIFLYYALKVRENQLIRDQQTATIPSVSKKQVLETTVALPSVEEQKIISSFLGSIDSTLTLCQRKLDLLTQAKKSLMQQIFSQKLRFKTDDGSDYPDWEEKKLGDIAEIVRGASPRPINDPKWFDNNSDVGWLRISDVTDQNGRIHYLQQHISQLGQEKTRVVTEPHLLLSIAATVGKPLINYVKTGVHDGFLIFLHPQFDLEYMYQWLEVFRPQWNKYGQPGTQVNLNSDLVKNQTILLPSDEEQKTIGSFLKRFDSVIDQARVELEQWQEVKKSLLQQMFV